MRILISILSDYLQPNFLLIKELKDQYDKLIFMTTPEMKKKKKDVFLEKALGLPENSTKRIFVVEDDFDYIKKELNGQQFNDADDYILNITGGTKVMSIVVYEYFQKKKAKFYYVPIGKNIIKDLQTEQTIQLQYRLNLSEYLTLNSLRYESDNTLLCDAQTTYSFFNELKKRNFQINYRIKNAHNENSPELKRYYSGEWFEEYVYLRIKKDFYLQNEDIASSLKIFRDDSKTNDNEIDVAFVKDNILNVIECKVSMFGYGREPQETIEEYLYKLAAISKDFGLHVNSYLFTLHKMNLFSKKILENIHKRANILGIRGIIDGPKLSEDRLKL